MLRAAAAGFSVIVAAVSGVVTALATAHPTRGLWVALGVLVIVCAALQAAVTLTDRGSSRRVVSAGAGAVAVGGSAGEIRTRVEDSASPVVMPGGDGVVASGTGAIAVGGDAAGPVSTNVDGPDGRVRP